MKTLSDFIRQEKTPWYRELFPFLPIIFYNNELRKFTFRLIDCTTIAKPITKYHFIDLLIFAHRRKWWHPKYIGFQIWLC